MLQLAISVTTQAMLQLPKPETTNMSYTKLCCEMCTVSTKASTWQVTMQGRQKEDAIFHYGKQLYLSLSVRKRNLDEHHNATSWSHYTSTELWLLHGKQFCNKSA